MLVSYGFGFLFVLYFYCPYIIVVDSLHSLELSIIQMFSIVKFSGSRFLTDFFFGFFLGKIQNFPPKMS